MKYGVGEGVGGGGFKNKEHNFKTHSKTCVPKVKICTLTFLRERATITTMANFGFNECHQFLEYFMLK